MAERRRGLGRGIGALIPQDQQEKAARPIDVFFSSTSAAAASEPDHNDETSIQTPPHPTSKPTRTTVPRSSQQLTETNTNVGTKSSEQKSDQELLPVPGATFGELPVNQIVANMKQPRQIFDEDELQELADSIQEVGILQPIVVRPIKDPIAEKSEARYELIMGERRWRATQQAGLTTIPAIIKHTEDSDLLRDALLENLHRAQLNALEEAAAYQQLLDDFQITQEELSKKIARSRPQISNTLRLLKLPPLVQRRVAAGILSAGHARALLSLNDPAAMERLAQRIVAEGLSVRAVEEIVAVGSDASHINVRARAVRQHEAELNALARRLGDKLDTRVKVTMGSHKGRIAVEFSDLDDLNRILSVLGENKVE